MAKNNSYTSSFKKLALKFLLPIIVCFLFLGLGIDYVFTQKIIFNSSTSGASKINRLAHNTAPLEIPILGSSRANYNFAPSKLGENYYNYGMDGCQDNVWMYLLEIELQKKKQSPIVINFDMDGLSNGTGDILNYIPNISIDKTTALIGEKNDFIFQIPFLRYFGKYDQYLKFFLQDKTNATKQTDNGAALEKNKTTPQRLRKNIEQQLKASKKFTNNPQLNQKLKKILSSTDRKIIFVITPVHNSYFKNDESHASTMKYLTQLSKAYPHVKHLDYSKSLNDDKYFFNTTHLNMKGAYKFSTLIKNDLNHLIQQH